MTFWRGSPPKVASRRLRWGLLVPFLAMLPGCQTSSAIDPVRAFKVGGPCRYDLTTGLATLLIVRPSGGSVEMEVALDVPTGFQSAAGWSLHQWRVEILAPAEMPDVRWLAANGIFEGARYPVELSVIREGTCTPVLLRFPGRPWIVR